MANRDDDRTLIDIRMQGDVFDPNVHPASFDEDLAAALAVQEALAEGDVNGHSHLNLGPDSEDLNLPAIVGFVVGLVAILAVYGGWVLLRAQV